VQTTVQQVGGALGLACLVRLALRHADGEFRQSVLHDLAAIHGYALSSRIGAALLAVGGVLVLVLLEHVTAQPHDPSPSSARSVTDAPSSTLASPQSAPGPCP
jgi:hypothetical protein